MRYLSTRGDSEASSKKSFTEILLGGLAPDGGLYLPEVYPQISRAELDAWRGLSYADLAFAVLSKFVDDIPATDLKKLVDKTYTGAVYCNGRDPGRAGEITPVRWLESGFGLLELSNGPTLAFKDMAMQLLGNLFEYVLAREGEEINILGATSGDTGSAAEYAMCGKRGVRVFMLSPYGKMSAFQRAQMYSLQDANIFNIAVRGMFDDAQDIVKAVSNDAEFKAKYKIGAVNSINWARIVAQVVYYFTSATALGAPARTVDFTVPTGNFGDIFAGYIAQKMGLPIDQLVIATRLKVLQELINNEQQSLIRVTLIEGCHHLLEGVLVVELLVGSRERIADTDLFEETLKLQGDDLAQRHLQPAHLDAQHLEATSDRGNRLGDFGVADHRCVGGVFSHQRQHRHQVRFTGAVVADDQHALVIDRVVETELRNHEFGDPLGHVVGDDVGRDELLGLVRAPGIEQLND